MLSFCSLLRKRIKRTDRGCAVALPRGSSFVTVAGRDIHQKFRSRNFSLVEGGESSVGLREAAELVVREVAVAEALATAHPRVDDHGERGQDPVDPRVRGEGGLILIAAQVLAALTALEAELDVVEGASLLFGERVVPAADGTTVRVADVRRRAGVEQVHAHVVRVGVGVDHDVREAGVTTVGPRVVAVLLAGVRPVGAVVLGHADRVVVRVAERQGVGLPVAVLVVEVARVADLDARLTRDGVAHGGVRAVTDRDAHGHAVAETERTDLTQAEALVRRAVAVVVRAVAGVVRGDDLAHARPPLGHHAGAPTALAEADALGALGPAVAGHGEGVGVHGVLVGHAVAVVVHAVTGLGHRSDLTVAGAPLGVHAGADAHDALALVRAAAHGDGIVQAEDVVDVAVAVVIDAVADLHGRRALLGAVLVGQGVAVVVRAVAADLVRLTRAVIVGIVAPGALVGLALDGVDLAAADLLRAVGHAVEVAVGADRAVHALGAVRVVVARHLTGRVVAGVAAVGDLHLAAGVRDLVAHGLQTPVGLLVARLGPADHVDHVAPHVRGAVHVAQAAGALVGVHVADAERAVRVLVATAEGTGGLLVEGHALVEVLVVRELVAPAQRAVLVLAARGLALMVLRIAHVLRVDAVRAHRAAGAGLEADAELAFQPDHARTDVGVALVAVGQEAAAALIALVVAAVVGAVDLLPARGKKGAHEHRNAQGLRENDASHR